MLKRRNLFTICFLAVFATATLALAQDKKPGESKPAAKAPEVKAGDKTPATTAGQPSAEEMAMIKKMMDAGTPGEAHAKLKPMTGKWTFTSKWRMSPDQPWDESTGKADYKWILGNRILTCEIKTDPNPAKDAMMGGPFEGFGMTGYDNVSKKYFNIWSDSVSTGIMISHGTADGSGKVFTYSSEYHCPITGGQKNVKTISKIDGDDKMIFQMYDRDDKGKEFMSGEVAYTRAK